MFRKTLTLVAGVATGFLMVLSPEGQTAEVLVAVGHEIQTAILDPGEVRCIGGEPTGDPFFLCSSDTNQIQNRNRVSQLNYINLAGSAASMFDGPNFTAASCNFDSGYQGRCWGTFRWEIPGHGGAWEGTWRGEFDLAAFTAIYAVTGHGVGGDLEGLQLSVQGVYPGGVPYATFVAQVLIPGQG